MDTKRRCVRESLRSAQVTAEPKGAEDPKPTTPCSANTKRGMRNTHTHTHIETHTDIYAYCRQDIGATYDEITGVCLHGSGSPNEGKAAEWWQGLLSEALPNP